MRGRALAIEDFVALRLLARRKAPRALLTPRPPDNTGRKQAGGGMSGLPGFTRPLVWEHSKRDGRLVAGQREYRGAEFFELRLWIGKNGDRATQKGVTMPLEAVPDLARALTAYAATLPPEAAGSGS
jgi:hypothetical protein